MPYFPIFGLLAGLFLADALFNWGMFRTKPRYRQETYAERNRRYGPIERAFRIGVGALMVGVLVMVAGMFFARGGVRALLHPDEYTGANSLSSPPPHITRAPAPVLPTPAAPEPEPTPGPEARVAAEPAPEPEPEPAAVSPSVAPTGAVELRFWLYDDAEGVTHMVDALGKVPAAFRGSARELP